MFALTPPESYILWLTGAGVLIALVAWLPLALRRLQAAVAQLGGTPEDDATTLGSIHRVFVDLKSAVAGRDDKAIVNEVERGEDYLKEKFETAMRNTDLSVRAQAAVNEAWTSVRSGHDQMSQLKHSIA